jgi:hypothetical protein
MPEQLDDNDNIDEKSLNAEKVALDSGLARLSLLNSVFADRTLSLGDLEMVSENYLDMLANHPDHDGNIFDIVEEAKSMDLLEVMDMTGYRFCFRRPRCI